MSLPQDNTDAAGYTETALVEQPAIALLAELGWETFNAYREFDHGNSRLGRATKAEVILIDRLRPALERLNPEAPPEAIEQAIAVLSGDRSRMSLAAANREIYEQLKNGARVTVPDPDDSDGETVAVVQLIDWERPANNDFLLCSQFWVTGEMYTRRPDLVGFVNGLPLLFIELKAIHLRLESAYSGNLRDYKDTIPQLFWPNALIILSNGSHSRVGSITAGWEHLAEWKKAAGEVEPEQVSLETMLRGVCEPTRLLDIVENFTLFQEAPNGLIKLIARNHQYHGVNNAIAVLLDIRQRKGRLGVFWHTQGSGKSVSMIFFAQKAQRKLPGNWSFVIVTDRQELERQIYTTFTAAGVVTESRAKAKSGVHLRQLLSEDHRYIFTLIHKFQVAEEISTRDDIIVITDEAHRSQYDMLALNMRTAMPNAAFLAFTGTPLITGEEEKTRQVFGDYISIYDFQQSVKDGATVPLYYENRIPDLQLVNEALNQDMERLLDEAALDEDQERQLERRFVREYHLITREDRLEAIAEDLVKHFIGRGFEGKAMMICIDKATTIRMYDKVCQYWEAKIAELITECALAGEDEKANLSQRIAWMQATDMAVVVSQGQNEIAEMADKGLDIRPHRRRMVFDDLEVKFKNPADPLRLAFVCAMWMTGFDVPICSTLYLDKPMRNHTLMQTIARANRVYPGKEIGLIVDYIGVLRNLEKALVIYGGGDSGGEKPLEDKHVLVVALRQVLEDARDLCRKCGVDLAAIDSAKGLERIQQIDDAVEALVSAQPTKRRYLELTNTGWRLYKAVLPDPAAPEFTATVLPLRIIANKIRVLTEAADISSVIPQVESLLDDSIATEGYVIREPGVPYGDDHLLDLSTIDLKKLAEEFKSGRKHTLNEKFKKKVARKLKAMVRLNRTRADYLCKFEEMINAYNAGSLNAEESFNQLLAFAQDLHQEEQRGVSEGLSEEELALFDLLTKPDIKISAVDRKKLKAVARELLQTLKDGKLVLDWRKRQQARAEVRVTISKALETGLPRAFTVELFEQKTADVFEHVYDAYYGDERSIYATAA